MNTEDLLKYSEDTYKRSGGDISYEGQREYLAQRSLMASHIAGAQELLGIRSELAIFNEQLSEAIHLLAKLVTYAENMQA